jgi:hypothetical protein
MEKHVIYVDGRQWRRFRAALLRDGYASASVQIRHWIDQYLKDWDEKFEEYQEAREREEF